MDSNVLLIWLVSTILGSTISVFVCWLLGWLPDAEPSEPRTLYDLGRGGTDDRPDT